MTPADLQHAVRFLTILYATSSKFSADVIRRAAVGPSVLDDIPLTVPWQFVEAVIQFHPAFLADPARKLLWELRDADPLNRVRLTKALVDASDNQTLDAVDLRTSALVNDPGLAQRMAAMADDLAEVLADDAYSPSEKAKSLQVLLATL